MYTYVPGNAAMVVAYGHLGDGNVHLNVSAPKYDEQVLILLSKIFQCLNFSLRIASVLD